MRSFPSGRNLRPPDRQQGYRRRPIDLSERLERLGGDLRGRLGHAITREHRPAERARGPAGRHVQMPAADDDGAQR